MNNTPWKSDLWNTSHWNFAPEATKDFSFAKKIKLHDITMRDGEQQAGVLFNKDQKVALAEKLAEVGVHRIEAGMPVVTKQDREAIEEIVKRNFGPEIFSFGRCVKGDAKIAADMGVKGVIVEIPCNPDMIIHSYGWTPEKALDLAIETTAYAHELGLYTVFFLIDYSRAPIDWAFHMIDEVNRQGHMDALTLVDTVGGMAPHAVGNMVRYAKSRVNKPIEVHFHDDFGLGAANTIYALAAGADVAHTTISAIGERAGNTSYEEVALTLLTMFGVDLGLNYEKIYGTSKFMRDMLNVSFRSNQPIVGDNIGMVESGIPAMSLRKIQKNGAPKGFVRGAYSNKLTGAPDGEIVMGKFSGAANVEFWLDDLGITFEDDAKKLEIVNKVKDKAFEVMRLLTRDEFKEIVDQILK